MKAFDVISHYVPVSEGQIHVILTRPTTCARHPVLFLIQGLGSSTIDEPLHDFEESRANSSYVRIIRSFAESGYVTVRVEKPGIGCSEGEPQTEIDFETELNAFHHSLMAVRQMPFVDPDRIVIFGHSIGGIFAPIIGNEISVKGIAVYGTTHKNFVQYAIENTHRQAVLSGHNELLADELTDRLAAVLNLLLVEGRGAEEIILENPHLENTVINTAPEGILYGRSIRFWSQVTSKDMTRYWENVNTNVLSLWGVNDFITSEADHQAIAEIVSGCKGATGQFRAVHGSDHDFRQTTSQHDSFKRWYKPEAEFNPQTIRILKEWTASL